MPTFQFEAMDKTGQEVRDVIEADNQEEAQATIRSGACSSPRSRVKKARKGQGEKVAGAKKGKTFVLGGVNSKMLTTFTRQLAILQEAGLPILRSLKILEQQAKPGALKNSLIDVCDEIESGSTLSEAMGKSPKAFNRLYVNMIKAGEAGGALEIILKRLAEFQERAQSLKRKVRGAMIYPIFVVLFAVSILVFIMMKIVPQFQKIFKDFDTKLPDITHMLINISELGGPAGSSSSRPSPSATGCTSSSCGSSPRGGLGWDFFALEGADLRPARREEHRRPHHAHAGHAGGQRRADPGGPAHHAGDLRQCGLRKNVRPGLRLDPRRRIDRQADERELLRAEERRPPCPRWSSWP